MKIGISSCLLGNCCRYDGGHSKDSFLVNDIGKYFQFIPYCPEKHIFPTPREAIRLVRIDNEIRVKSSNNNIDVTKEIHDISKQLTDSIYKNEICGFILKSKSPTCGMERVKVYSSKKDAQSENVGVGIFAQEIKNRFPYLPIEEEGRLNDAWLRESFLMQLFAYKSISEFISSNPNFKDLVQFHSKYKYLIYSKSHESYKLLGKIVANHEKKDINTILDEYKNMFLKTIAIKSKKSNICNVLFHIYGYFKKEINKDEKIYLLELIDEFKNGIIPLIAVIKTFLLYINKYEIEYLKNQVFLDPYPKELALRSKIEAFK